MALALPFPRGSYMYASKIVILWGCGVPSPPMQQSSFSEFLPVVSCFFLFSHVVLVLPPAASPESIFVHARMSRLIVFVGAKLCWQASCVGEFSPRPHPPRYPLSTPPITPIPHECLEIGQHVLSVGQVCLGLCSGNVQKLQRSFRSFLMMFHRLALLFSFLID